jgi:hypothetical protein
MMEKHMETWQTIVYILLGLMVLEIIGCVAVIPRHETDAVVKDDIREAVYRYLLSHNVEDFLEGDWVFFLALDKEGDWKSPGPEFMKRFIDHKPPVRAVSEALIHKGNSGRVTDKWTGQNGIVLFIGQLQWVDRNMARVEGGYYVQNLFASGNYYYVELKDGAWVVTKEAMHWIS